MPKTNGGAGTPYTTAALRHHAYRSVELGLFLTEFMFRASMF